MCHLPRSWCPQVPNHQYNQGLVINFLFGLHSLLTMILCISLPPKYLLISDWCHTRKRFWTLPTQHVCYVTNLADVILFLYQTAYFRRVSNVDRDIIPITFLGITLHQNRRQCIKSAPATTRFTNAYMRVICVRHWLKMSIWKMQHFWKQHTCIFNKTPSELIFSKQSLLSYKNASRTPPKTIRYGASGMNQPCVIHLYQYWLISKCNI